MSVITRILLLNIIFLPLFLKANVNEDFIKTKKASFDKWSKNLKFVEGEIYLNKDTFSIQIMDFKIKQKKNYFIFCVVKYKNDSIVFLSSIDIEGFNVKNEYFFKNDLMDESFFMQRVCSGNFDLFVKKSIPSDNRYLFFLKKKEKYVHYILNPIESNITNIKVLPNNTTVVVETKLLGESFKKFIYMQMGDCEEVRNIVRSEFYKMEDLGNIVDIYNSWFINNKIFK